MTREWFMSLLSCLVWMIADIGTLIAVIVPLEEYTEKYTPVLIGTIWAGVRVGWALLFLVERKAVLFSVTANIVGGIGGLLLLTYGELLWRGSWTALFFCAWVVGLLIVQMILRNLLHAVTRQEKFLCGATCRAIPLGLFDMGSVLVAVEKYSESENEGLMVIFVWFVLRALIYWRQESSLPEFFSFVATVVIGSVYFSRLWGMELLQMSLTMTLMLVLMSHVLVHIYIIPSR